MLFSRPCRDYGLTVATYPNIPCLSSRSLGYVSPPRQFCHYGYFQEVEHPLGFVNVSINACINYILQQM